jgi:hypothetical protein
MELWNGNPTPVISVILKPAVAEQSVDIIRMQFKLDPLLERLARSSTIKRILHPCDRHAREHDPSALADHNIILISVDTSTGRLCLYNAVN